MKFEEINDQDVEMSIEDLEEPEDLTIDIIIDKFEKYKEQWEIEQEIMNNKPVGKDKNYIKKPK